MIRLAKLFEAGDYPDRRLSFSESDLDTIVNNFSGEVPIKIEHTDTVFDGKLGKVVKIWRSGKDLMGSIEWPDSVWQFLCNMGAKSLSVGFDMANRCLKEVSLVGSPRVLTAQVFSDNIQVFSSEVEYIPKGEKSKMDEKDVALLLQQAEARGVQAGIAQAEAQFSERIKGYSSRIAEMERSDSMADASLKIAMWKQEGKLPPACEKFAQAILVDGVSEVTFSDGGHMPIRDAFVQFMTHMPLLVEMSGTKAKNPEDSVQFSEDSKSIFNALGLDEEELELAVKGEGE